MKRETTILAWVPKCLGSVREAPLGTWPPTPVRPGRPFRPCSEDSTFSPCPRSPRPLGALLTQQGWGWEKGQGARSTGRDAQDLAQQRQLRRTGDDLEASPCAPQVTT